MASFGGARHAGEGAWHMRRPLGGQQLACLLGRLGSCGCALEGGRLAAAALGKRPWRRDSDGFGATKLAWRLWAGRQSCRRTTAAGGANSHCIHPSHPPPRRSHGDMFELTDLHTQHTRTHTDLLPVSTDARLRSMSLREESSRTRCTRPPHPSPVSRPNPLIAHTLCFTLHIHRSK